MSDVIFFNPPKAMGILVDGGIPKTDAINHLVRLKNTRFCVIYDGTSYFDSRELNRIIEGNLK